MGFLNFKRLSLKMRFIWSFIFVIIVTMTIVSLTNYFRWNRNYLRQVRDEGLILTQTLAQGCIDPIIRNDFYTLNEYVDTLFKRPNIAYVVITGRHDQVLAQSAGAIENIPGAINKNVKEISTSYLVQTYVHPALKTRINDITVPVLIDGKKWGTVRVGFSLEHIRAKITKNILVVMLTGLISMVIGIAVALVLSRFVTDPIEQFVRSMKTIAAGDLEQQIRINTRDEFSVLAKSFNLMARSLQESQKELEKTYQRLMQKEKMAALGELTARITHEIKNPLGIIKGSAQILVDETEEPEIRTEVGGFIIEEVNRLDKKVRDLLNYARPNPPVLQKVELNDVLEKRIQFWESQRHEGQNIQIIKRFNWDIPPLLLDRDQIGQVILNLLLNACEAMPDGGEITVTTDLGSLYAQNTFGNDGEPRRDRKPLTSEVALLKFTDTGIGIPEKDVQKIFDPFFTTKEKGTGLGLSTVIRIIENHKGKIEVESKTGEVTTFIICFPLTDNGGEV